MKKIIILFLILLSASFAIVTAQTNFEVYYKFNLTYDYGNITINSMEIEFSKEKIENSFGFYTAKVFDYDNKTLDMIFFDIPNEILYETINPETGEIEGGGLLELNETSFEIFVPYYEDSNEIIIYNLNLIELTKKDISEFSKQRKEIVKNEEKVKSKESGTENFIEKSSEYWGVLLVILFILVIILFYSLRKTKN